MSKRRTMPKRLRRAVSTAEDWRALIENPDSVYAYTPEFKILRGMVEIGLDEACDIVDEWLAQFGEDPITILAWMQARVTDPVVALLAEADGLLPWTLILDDGTPVLYDGVPAGELITQGKLGVTAE